MVVYFEFAVLERGDGERGEGGAGGSGVLGYIRKGQEGFLVGTRMERWELL